MDDEKLARYRQQWTVEHPRSRHARYETESRRATNIYNPSQFQVSSVRYLPGTPRPVEHFRERLVEKFGILSFCFLRREIGGPGQVSIKQLQQIVKRLELRFTFAEFNQVLMLLELVA